MHTLSGYFCASLVQVVPKYTTVSSIETRNIDERFHGERRAMLSSENICTENLTPFVKLLPCKKVCFDAETLSLTLYSFQRGLVSLLNAEWLVAKAHHYALSVHMARLCKPVDTCDSFRHKSLQYRTKYARTTTRWHTKPHWASRLCIMKTTTHAIVSAFQIRFSKTHFAVRLHVPSLCPLARSSNVHVRHANHLQVGRNVNRFSHKE